ncbi:MAG: mycofactocin precursor MftA [Halolamina sp.]
MSHSTDADIEESPAEEPDIEESPAEEPDIEEDLFEEELRIDGICGVY